jgi:3'-5' exoribonuclease
MQISEMQAGDNILGFYALAVCELIPFAGGVRLKLEFADNSGRIPGVMWGDDAESAHNEIKGTSVVKVKAGVGTYQGKLQLQVDKIRSAEPDEYDPSEFVPESPFPLAELEAGITELIQSLEDETLRTLASAIIFDDDIKPLYFAAPGGTRWHHPYIRGLAEHSLSMALAADRLCEHYEFLDRSLLIVGALLHDLGKIDEMSVDTALSYTEPGRLYGHIVMGYERVKSKAISLGVAEDINVIKLLHMILSHQGKHEYSVPVEPCFEEAFVLYFIDEMDSKLNAIERIRNKPENSDRDFSARVNLLNTHLYLKQKEVLPPDEDESPEC